MSSSGQDTPVVEIWFKIEKDSDGYPESKDWEGLRCAPVGADSDEYKILSVPFYLKNVAYGDVIRVVDRPEYLEFDAVVRRSGYSVVRVVLHDPGRKEELIRILLDADALVEQNEVLIAAAIPATADWDSVAGYILDGKSRGWWGAQEGYVPEE